MSAEGSCYHLSVASTDDVALASERFKRNGLQTFSEENTSCCYAVQDKTWVRDPDGNEWEVFVVLEDNLPETDHCECGDKVVVTETRSDAPIASSACCAPTTVAITHESQPTAASCC